MPCLRHVLAENDQRLDFPARMPSAICGSLMPISAEANAGEPRAVGVRILVRADQQLVAFAERATESLIAPSFSASFASSHSSSLVCRAEAMMATEPCGAFFSLSAISLSAAVQVRLSGRAPERPSTGLRGQSTCNSAGQNRTSSGR